MGGIGGIFPRDEIVTHFGSEATRNLMVTNGFVVPHFFTSYQVANRVWLGLGLSSPFGLGTKFDSNWPGRVDNIKTSIQTMNINPALAVKMTDILSFGKRAGHNVVFFGHETGASFTGH